VSLRQEGKNFLSVNSESQQHTSENIEEHLFVHRPLSIGFKCQIISGTSYLIHEKKNRQKADRTEKNQKKIQQKKQCDRFCRLSVTFNALTAIFSRGDRLKRKCEDRMK
jgi:hypothetical protein